MKFLTKYLKADSIFVDVGANIGGFAIPAAKLVSPKGHVITIGLSPRIFSYLQKNIEFCALSFVIYHLVLKLNLGYG